VFVAAADSGILQPEDLAGKKILVGLNAAPTLHAMMSRVGISSDDYVAETLAFDVKLFESGEFPVWSVYTTGSIRILEEAGYELNIIYPCDYGVHFYNDTIFGTDEFILENPELVLRFLRATLRGWRWAIENPEEAGPLALKYNPELDVEIQTDQMMASVPLVHTGEDQIGWMRAETWEDMHDILIEQGLLDGSCNVEDLYTVEFLEEIYGEEP
jgi:NitT/TauT family transport system substrate-binding protein